jgi:hypothetical protein
MQQSVGNDARKQTNDRQGPSIFVRSPESPKRSSLALYRVDHQYSDHNMCTAINVFGLAATLLDQRLSAEGGLDFWIL